MNTEKTTAGALLSPPPCSALRWTRNRPKAPGWYWLAAPVGYTPRIVRIYESERGLSVQAEGGHLWPLKKRGGWKGRKWAGPILPPNAHVEARRDGAPTPEKTSTPLPRTSC